MKSKNTIVAATLVAVAGLVVWQGSVISTVAAGETTAVTAATVGIAVTPLVGGDAEYIGDNKCKKCHFKVHKSWKKSPKYKSIDALKPGNASEAKAKHGLDTAKDYSTDESCVKCHVTGYGKPGGYAMHDTSDKAAAKKFKNVKDIGCESCHGPGSAYLALHEEIMKSKRKYTQEEMYAAGMRKIDESVCLECHNDKSPTFESFSFSEMKDKVHDHEEMKQRE